MGKDTLQIKIDLKGAKEANTELKKLRTSMQDVEDSSKGVSTSAAGLSGAMSAAGVGIMAVTAAAISAYKALQGLGSILTDLTESYIKQERAEHNLTNAMKIGGIYTKQSFKVLKDYASAMQRMTGIGDEIVLQQMAVAASYGLTTEQIKTLSKAAIDMATAEGKGSRASRTYMKQLAEALNDPRAAMTLLKKKGIELDEQLMKNGTKAQQQAHIIEKLAERYKGLSYSSDTLGTKLSLIGDYFGDIKEKGGQVIAAAIKPALESIITALADVNSYLETWVSSIEDVGSTIGEYLLPLVNYVIDAFKDLWDSSSVSSLVDSLYEMIDAMDDLGITSEIWAGLFRLIDALILTIKGGLIAIGAVIDAINVGLDLLKLSVEAVSEMIGSMTDLWNQVRTQIESVGISAKIVKLVVSQIQFAIMALQNPAAAVRGIFNHIKTTLSMIQSIVRGIGTALSSLRVPPDLLKLLSYSPKKGRSMDTGYTESGTEAGASAELPGETRRTGGSRASSGRRASSGGGGGGGGGGSATEDTSELEDRLSEIEEIWRKHWENRAQIDQDGYNNAKTESNRQYQTEILKLKRYKSQGLITESEFIEKSKVLLEEKHERDLRILEDRRKAQTDLLKRLIKLQKSYGKLTLKEQAVLQKKIKKADKDLLKTKKEIGDETYKYNKQLYEKNTKLIKKQMDEIKEKSKNIASATRDVFVSLGESIGMWVEDATANFKKFWQTIGEMILQGLESVIKAEQTKAIAKAMSANAGNPVAMIAAGVAAAAMFAPLYAAISIVKSLLPKMAEGGLVGMHGGVHAVVGEAGREAILPLDHPTALEGIKEALTKLGVTGPTVQIQSPILLTNSKNALKEFTKTMQRESYKYQRRYRAV